MFQSTRLPSYSLTSGQHAKSSTMAMSETCASAVCKQTKFGASWEQKLKTSGRRKKRKDGVTCGRGPDWMPTRNYVSVIWWADATGDGQKSSCKTAPAALMGAFKSPLTVT